VGRRSQHTRKAAERHIKMDAQNNIEHNSRGRCWRAKSMKRGRAMTLKSAAVVGGEAAGEEAMIAQARGGAGAARGSEVSCARKTECRWRGAREVGA